MNLPPFQLSLRVAPTGNIDEPPIADGAIELKQCCSASWTSRQTAP